MRILYLVPWEDFGGPHNLAIRLKRTLEQQQVEMMVLLPEEEGSAAGRLEQARVPVLKTRLHRLRNSFDPRVQLGFFGGLAREVFAIKRIIKEQQIDLVQVCSLPNPHGALAARVARVPVVWQIGDMTPKPLRHLLMPMVRRLADVVMTFGEALARLHPGVTELGERLIVFFPPVDTELFRPEARRREAARRDFGLSDGELVIGTIANINRFKDTITFVRAAALLRKSFPQARFVILGSTLPYLSDYAKAVWREASSLGLHLGEDLIQRDAGARVADLAQAFDIFWLTSVTEGAPNALLEAMALGLPVIATAVGAVPEMIRPGLDGFITAPRDAEAIAGRTAEIIRDARLRALISASARRTALERYRPETCAQAHLRAYHTALAHARQRYRAGASALSYHRNAELDP
jgi:glycosyltransferase involved in cell wall biosynthesis